MLFVYQIGDVPLFNYIVGTDDPVQTSLERNWDLPSIYFPQSGGTLYQGPANRSIAQATKMKIEGVVQARSSALAQELLTSLQMIGGRLSIPLIVFRFEDAFNLGTDVSQIDWLVADVSISSKNLGLPYAGLDLGEAGHVRLRLDIEVVLMTPFRRLLPWFWEYRAFRDRQQNPYVADGSSSGDLLFNHPRTFSEIVSEFYFVRWMDRDTLLEPEFWEIAFSVDGGQGMEFEELYEIFYHSDPMRWSAPPLIVYAFTELLPYGSLTIRVQRSTGQFYGDDYEEDSVLDLVALDAELALQGYGGLFNSDILYVGNVFPFPSYILRNGEVLESITPNWSYAGLFPGELQGGAGRVRFIVDLSSLLLAYSFAYGVF